jgi:hypothetical protein
MPLMSVRNPNSANSRGSPTALLLASGILIAIASIVCVTGGFRTSIGSIRISVQRPATLSIGAWGLLVLAARRMNHEVLTARLVALKIRCARMAASFALALAVTVVIAALALEARVAAGADPYGYVSQALLWAAGNPVQLQPQIALDAPWPNADWSFSPLGSWNSLDRAFIVDCQSTMGYPVR